jgi:hypothetical protein
MNNLENLDYQLYVLAELSYKKEHPEINEEDLFPKDWYSTRNYKLKSEIIAKALNNNILIEQVEEYNLMKRR